MFLSQQNVGAYYTDSGWINFTQPDGTSFVGRGWGDEFEFQWETQDGYRIVMDYMTGFWCYANLDAKGDYAPSEYIVGKHDPSVAGIPKRLSRSSACQDEIRRKREEFERILESIRNQRRGGGSRKVGGISVQSATTIEIFAILVEFKDIKHDRNIHLPISTT